MQVAQNKVVSFHYTLTGPDGTQLDSSAGGAPLTYLHGASNIIPGLEKALEGKRPGDRLNVVVEPEEAYGLADEALIQEVPREAFQGVDHIEPGMRFQADSSHGPMLVVVTKVEGDTVTVDGNHPLAGMRLTFDVEITDVRDATPEEIAHGHAHEPGEH
ncbi:MAG: peptidylprolyl isomerase [Gammaproteobacteria bacterium]|nr:MAG: peptidylprolyl isomerase [Gammaproteobacteria bacterium]